MRHDEAIHRSLLIFQNIDMSNLKTNKNKIIVLDGHDGSGKTTLSKMLAAHINGIYVRPFGGKNGKVLIESAEKKEYELTIQIGIDSIQQIYNQHTNQTLVFDRHWMTVLSLLPEQLWKKWTIYPPTILCWANLQTTKKRLHQRMEQKFDDEYHQSYLNIYKNLVSHHNSLIIDTNRESIQDSLNTINQWLNNNNI